MTKEYDQAVASLGNMLRIPDELLPLHPLGRDASSVLATQMEKHGQDPSLRWGWSVDKNPETWIGAFTSREEAIADAQAHSWKTFYIMSGHIPDSSRFMPDSDAIVDMLGEAASGEAGDSAEDFPDVSSEGLAELDELLKAWSSKHLGACTFWISNGEPEKIVPVEPTIEVQEPA